MELSEDLRAALLLANNGNAVPDLTFKCLLENLFGALTSGTEPHNTAKLYNSKPDLIKELYAGLLQVTCQFARHSTDKDAISKHLLDNCNYPAHRVKLYLELYDKYTIMKSLVNCGSYLPHVTDVSWKIDHQVKSSGSDLNCEPNAGPVFRVSLQTERQSRAGSKIIDNLDFSCTSQELQDLVYKLKDAVRHCQKIGNSEH